MNRSVTAMTTSKTEASSTTESQHAVGSQVDRGVRRVRAPKTIGYQLQKGDKFTIEGWGTSARGHQVRNGRSAKTGRKMKVKTLQIFVVKSASSA
jgi:nucleoid DNA-binding protein